MQNTFAGMNPNCAVRKPIMQIITLFTAASTHPSQHLLPIKTVETMVKTQDR
jgi:hypothetical protein